MTRKRQSEARNAEKAIKPVAGVRPSFPIVGIGASAGGLEALESFLRHLPDKSGLGFVVVQHLDPTQKGMLAELLARATPMKVLQVKDR
jgi:two-component system CheB/CheR fusion protein